MPADLCHTCRARHIKAKGECGTCHEYRRRHGTQRPVELASRQYDLNRRRLDLQIARDTRARA